MSTCPAARACPSLRVCHIYPPAASLTGYLLWRHRPVHQRRGVALLAALLQLRLQLSGKRGLEAAETSSLPRHPAEKVGNKKMLLSQSIKPHSLTTLSLQ